MKTCGCDVRLRLRVRSLCGVCRARIHIGTLSCGACVWLFLFGDRGDCEVALTRSARSLAQAAPYPKGQGDPTSTCHSCRPTVGVGQDDSRALTLLTLPGEKRYSGPRSLVSPCRVPHDTAWVLCGVSAAAHQTRTVPGTLVHSPLTLI